MAHFCKLSSTFRKSKDLVAKKDEAVITVLCLMEEDFVMSYSCWVENFSLCRLKPLLAFLRPWFSKALQYVLHH